MDKKAAFRSLLFRHLDGLVMTPVTYVLGQHKVLQHICNEKQVDITELSKKFNANEGYMNVALRMFSSQGWMTQALDNKTNTVAYHITPEGEVAFKHHEVYKETFEFIQHSFKFIKADVEPEFFFKLDRAVKSYKACMEIVEHDNKEVADQIRTHIEGAIVGPIIVQLGMGGMFHKYFMEASFSPEEFHRNPQDFRKILDFLSHIEWFNKTDNGHYEFTDKGLFFAKRSTAYGVTVSYLPLFRNVEEMLFGDPHAIRDTGEDEDEKHVDREMNVWGSGGAHATYFKVMDEIIMELFNRPIEEQPKGILDMGCGNGAFLQHAFDVVERYTLRGKMLDEHPLFLVGADYNQAALKVTRANLIKSDIWAKVIWGDIGRPDVLAKDLKENYKIELKDLLNVRTFLDHNRIWSEPKKQTKGRISTSTGAYVHRGERLSNNLVEDNLLEHLQKWAPYVEKFGLLMIELHTVPPDLVAQNLGKTAATAYDATHGFSDQYIVEIDVFHKVAKEAGLIPDKEFYRQFPDSDLGTISINLLKGK